MFLLRPQLGWSLLYLFRAQFFKTDLLQAPASLLISCVILGKLFHFSESELPVCQMVVLIVPSSQHRGEMNEILQGQAQRNGSGYQHSSALGALSPSFLSSLSVEWTYLWACPPHRVL